MPEMTKLYELFQKALAEPLDASAKLSKYMLLRQGLTAIWKKHSCHPVQLVLTPMVHIPVFVSFVMATRSVIREGGGGLEEGGILWFTDLTAVDPTLSLPAAAIVLTYINLDLGLGVKQMPLLMWLKDKLQIIMIFSAPFVVQLPAGTVCVNISTYSFCSALSWVFHRFLLLLLPRRFHVLDPVCAIRPNADHGLEAPRRPECIRPPTTGPHAPRRSTEANSCGESASAARSAVAQVPPCRGAWSQCPRSPFSRR
jgi:hypothetical protein